MGVYIMELTEKKEFDLLSLGEIMLRLSPPDNERITIGDSFSKQAGGAELNAITGAAMLGFSETEAASIAIIGGADGPTAIFVSSKLLGAGASISTGTIALAAYTYMALVPIIQPPIMKALTTKKDSIRSMR